MKKLKKISISLAIIGLSFIVTPAAYAQTCPATPCLANQACVGGYCVDQPANIRPDISGQTPGALGVLVGRFAFYLFPLVGILGFIFFLWSGIQFLTSRGDTKAIEAAKNRLTHATMGLVIIFMAYIVTQYVFSLFNLTFIP